LPRLSGSFRSGLEALATQYQAALSPAALSYLAGRGIDGKAVKRYRLGQVTRESEYGSYAGMIAIPYITGKGGVVSIKFRRTDDGKPKYLTPFPTRLYNTLAMDEADELGFIAITEGEFDAIILDCYCGIPAVGIPGADTWAKHPEWRELFRGYRDIYMFADNDDAGRALAGRVTHDIRDSHAVTLTSGDDVSSAYLAGGLAEIRRKAGLDG
jgi:DNA primase